MNTNERIKLLRKELGLTQNEFGEKIGLKKSAISQIENGSTSSNPRIVQLICTAFNISEKWLTEGKGDMYTSDEEAILDKLAGMYDLSESQMIFAKQWLQLPATAKDAVVDYIVSVASALQGKKAEKKKDEATITATLSMDDYNLLQEIKAEEAEQQASASGSTAKESKEIS